MATAPSSPESRAREGRAPITCCPVATSRGCPGLSPAGNPLPLGPRPGPLFPPVARRVAISRTPDPIRAVNPLPGQSAKRRYRGPQPWTGSPCSRFGDQGERSSDRRSARRRSSIGSSIGQARGAGSSIGQARGAASIGQARGAAPISADFGRTGTGPGADFGREAGARRSPAPVGGLRPLDRHRAGCRFRQGIRRTAHSQARPLDDTSIVQAGGAAPRSSMASIGQAPGAAPISAGNPAHDAILRPLDRRSAGRRWPVGQAQCRV